jgi:hypothetical protein
MPKTRTMYMHTIDGKPASYDEPWGRPYLYFAGGRSRRSRAKLVPTLTQLRHEQIAAAQVRIAEGLTDDRARYGYVLVEVPA